MRGGLPSNLDFEGNREGYLRWLSGNERNQHYSRHLLRAQHRSRIAQIGKQQSKAEPAVAAASPKYDEFSTVFSASSF
jgi:hypothetical protein